MLQTLFFLRTSFVVKVYLFTYLGTGFKFPFYYAMIYKSVLKGASSSFSLADMCNIFSLLHW
jgi:hypothetical protein